MALPSTLKSSLTADPTAQRLAELEARIAKLESALIIGPAGTVTLRSGTNIVIDSSSAVTIKSLSSMTLQSAGTLTLKGSTVNLN